MKTQEFIDIYTSDDTSGGRKLKVTGSLNDLSDELTTSDPNGGRMLKIDLDPGVLSDDTTAALVPTPNYDLFILTAQGSALDIDNPTGTWVQGQAFMIRIKDDATPRAITWDTKYRAIGITLPVTTTASKTTYVGVIYNETDDKFDCISTVTEA